MRERHARIVAGTKQSGTACQLQDAMWETPAAAIRRMRWPLPALVDRCCYLPREVFFGRLGFAGVFFSACADDFGRFLPATSDSFPVDVLPAHPTEVAPEGCHYSGRDLLAPSALMSRASS